MDSLSTAHLPHLQWVLNKMGVGRAGWALFFFLSPIIGRSPVSRPYVALGMLCTTSDYTGEGTQKRLSRNIDCSLTYNYH